MTDLLKILHILATVVLLGNLLMAPFWRRRLAIIGGPQGRAVANRTVRVADLMFTLPGWVITLATGLVMAIKGGFFKNSGWVHISLLLFLIWLVAWHMGTLRFRKVMIAKADEAAASGQTAEDLAQSERQWAQWSYLSAGVVILILILMVTRPFSGG
jgi:uncharacterized membrane protein